MARKYEYDPGRYAWDLEKSEEVILIAGYEEIARFVPPDQTWRSEFEYHFFDRGNRIRFEFLDDINAVRKRKGLEAVPIKETETYDYAHSPDKQLRSNHPKEAGFETTAGPRAHRATGQSRSEACCMEPRSLTTRVAGFGLNRGHVYVLRTYDCCDGTAL